MATTMNQDKGEATPDSRWLHESPGRGELAIPEVRDWAFPGTDELFRSIYTRAGAGFVREVIAVSSAIDGEGKTTVAVGLAVAIAQDFPEKRVLLVETDVTRPVLADDFQTEPTPGLLDCLIAHQPLQDACRPTFLDNLQIVPGGGPATGVAGRPLRSSRIASIVDAMRQSYNVVILDLPSMLTNSDSALLTDLVDGVIYVVKAGITSTALVNRAIEQIDETKLRGVVLNGAHTAVPGWMRRITGI